MVKGHLTGCGLHSQFSVAVVLLVFLVLVSQLTIVANKTAATYCWFVYDTQVSTPYLAVLLLESVWNQLGLGKSSRGEHQMLQGFGTICTGELQN